MLSIWRWKVPIKKIINMFPPSFFLSLQPAEMCGTNFHIQNEMVNTIKMYMYHNARFERQQSAVDFRSGNDEFWLVNGMVDIETRRPEDVNSGYFGLRHENVVPLWSTSHIQPSIQLSIQTNNGIAPWQEHIIFIRCFFLLNNFQYKNAIFSGAVYRNAIKFAYIGYNVTLFPTLLVPRLV